MQVPVPILLKMIISSWLVGIREDSHLSLQAREFQPTFELETAKSGSLLGCRDNEKEKLGGNEGQRLIMGCLLGEQVRKCGGRKLGGYQGLGLDNAAGEGKDMEEATRSGLKVLSYFSHIWLWLCYSSNSPGFSLCFGIYVFLFQIILFLFVLLF